MAELQTESDETRIVQLIMNTSRLLACRADRAVESFGLFRGQAILLLILSDQDGCSHSEIAEKLEISPAAATKVIKRMEAMNFLERRSDPADERVSRVFLTGQGWAVSQHIKEAFHQNDLALVQMLTPEEQVTLASLLLRLHRSLSCQATGSLQPPTSLP